MKKRRFNMVEILLAMGVISIGFMSVISLLSIGMETHKNAQENTYVTLAAETMANYIRGESELYDLCEYKISTYSNNGITGQALRTTKMTYYSIDSMYSTAFKHEIESGSQTMELPDQLEFSEYKFTKRLIPDDITSSELEDNFTMMQSAKADRQFVKYHYLKWMTDVDGNMVTDFECIATVGLSPPNFPATSTGEGLNFEEGNSRLSVRIEWPAQAPIEQRNVKVFHYMVY